MCGPRLVEPNLVQLIKKNSLTSKSVQNQFSHVQHFLTESVKSYKEK